PKDMIGQRNLLVICAVLHLRYISSSARMSNILRCTGAQWAGSRNAFLQARQSGLRNSTWNYQLLRSMKACFSTRLPTPLEATLGVTSQGNGYFAKGEAYLGSGTILVIDELIYDEKQRLARSANLCFP